MFKFNFPHLDAASNAFFEREFDFVLARTFDKKYPELRARQLIPPVTGIPAGALSFTYRQYNEVGVAKIISSYADDLPRVDVLGQEFTAQIQPIGASFGFNVDEIDAAQMTGQPLEQRKANAARRAMERLIDSIACTGDAKFGLKGLLNVANALSYTVPNGVGGTATWGGVTPKTGLERLADLNGIVNEMLTETNSIETPDTILLPDAQYGLAFGTPLQAGSDTSVGTYFLGSNAFVKTLERWYRLAGAGAADTDRMVCYRRDPDALGLVVNKEITFYPPQQDGLEFVSPGHAKCGGVVVWYPLSVVYGDGI